MSREKTRIRKAIIKIREFALKKRVLVLSTIWAILLIASLLFVSLLKSSLVFDSNSAIIKSGTWSGYIINNEYNGNHPVTSITAKWKIPEVDANHSDAYSSAWIGIGDQSEKTLIQIGTEHDSLSRKENYRAWYEILPALSITITDFTMNPGDTIFASIELADAYQSIWIIQLNDTSNGKTFTKSIQYNSIRSSGEWIVERPTVNGRVSSLTDFGKITFMNCTLGLGGQVVTLGELLYSRVEMTNDIAVPLTSVSGLSVEGSSFTVEYVEVE